MIKSFGNLLAAFAVLGMAIPVQASEPPVQRTIQDVRLTKDNLLLGAVVGPAGELKPNALVQISHGKQVVATVRTDAKGRYAVKGLRTGVHSVKTAHQQSTCRFWKADVAPPTAKNALVLAHGSTVVRGQSGEGGVGSVLLPLAFFGAVAAVTIVSTTEDDDRTVSTPPASP